MNAVVFFKEAMEDARRLDAEFAESGRLTGPLHGVPISVKDSCVFPFSLLSRFSPASFH
jgi:Asp-tRNA(Asn)/Glu-tRNA(Gln) amidotransferase A subunit family amidase